MFRNGGAVAFGDQLADAPPERGEFPGREALAGQLQQARECDLMVVGRARHTAADSGGSRWASSAAIAAGASTNSAVDAPATPIIVERMLSC